ncbi:IclR family transcriptional regulator [Mycoplasmatota bacterium WC44]
MGKHIESLKKTLNILDLFLSYDRLGVTEISNITSYPTSTVHRILETLESTGYVYKSINTNKYKLGSKLYYLGKHTDLSKNIIDKSKGLIEALSKELLQTISMSMLSSNQSIVIYKKDSVMKMGMVPRIGEKKSLHCSASGKILTAYSNNPERIVEEIDFYPITENTITDKVEFMNEINKVKSSGFAIDNEEIELDLYCLAVPIFNSVGELVCSLSISGLKSRMLENIDSIRLRLLQTAGEISNLI